MAFQGLHQVQKQTQSLILAPQLRQSLKILQVPALELRNTILEELQTNPTLEELPMDDISIEQESSTGEEDSGDEDRKDEMDFGEDFEILRKLDEDWREHFAQESKHNLYTSEDAERRQHFFDSLVSETSLQEHLMRQAELADATESEQQALQYLIGSLDDSGFLSSTANDVALMANLPLTDVQHALELLRTFDPPGIGSANLKECLLAQLDQLGLGKSLAVEIIRKHYDLLMRRRIPDLARRTGSRIEEVQEALEEISRLDPAPARRFGSDSNRVVIPDVKVEKEENGDEWIITLNSDYVPRLRIASVYKNLIAQGNLSAKEKDYIREKIRSGKFLMSSIEQRQQTIERITREILQVQDAFFEHGSSHLKPLTMNEIAEKVGVHETTISRAIANKYIDTPFGVFDFKYFFTPGYKNSEGKSVSNTTVKEQIADIINSENPAKPYSDQDVVKILGERDVKIARRTVAKYREELGILATNLRRRYN